MPATVCAGGCEVVPDFYHGDSTSGKFRGSGKKTGNNCTGADPAPGPTGCADNECQAIINGSQVCIACGAPGTAPMSMGGGNTVNPDGTSVGQRKETVCKDGICTDTTITQPKNADGTDNGEATTETETRKKTPGDDPISDYCRTNPNASMCAALGPITDTVPLGTSSPSVTITPVVIGGAGSCPADIALPKGAVFSFTHMCSMASALKPIIIALAYLSAGLIVIGGFKNG